MELQTQKTIETIDKHLEDKDLPFEIVVMLKKEKKALKREKKIKFQENES